MSIAALSLAQNTAHAPAWIELIPAGAIVRGDDGRTWRNPDPGSVIKASRVSPNRPLPLDWEHATENRAPHGLDAPAAGWIEALELRAGAIWGRVAWTNTGRDHVANRAYRFVSPVFTYAKSDGRIGALKSVGLTNTPNLELTALNRRSAETDMEELNALWDILGLDEGATPGDVVDKVRQLATATATNRAEPDLARWVPMETFEAVTRELNSRNQGMTEELAEAHVADAVRTGKMVPALRDWGLALCRRDRPAFDAFLGRTGANLQSVMVGAVVPGRRPPGGPDTTSLGLWQLAFAANQPLNFNNYAAVRAAMMQQVGDNGRLLGVKPKLLVCGPSNEAAARLVLKAGTQNATSNIWVDSADLLVTPWLP